MPNTHSTLTSLFTDIANAIRAKKGTSADIVADNFPSEIASIPSGGITPSGSVTLTEENTYDVTDKAQAVVDFSATRANLAEAVTAKGVDTLPTSSFDTIATNIGLISGGGSLPSSISKIDGGSFTFAVDSKNNEISHNLGAVPKGFVVWTEDAELRNATAATDSYLLSAYVDCLNFTGGTGGVTAYAVQPTMFYKRANGNVSVTGNSTAALSNWATNSYFKISTSSVLYKANTTYKWIAWA